MPLNEKTTRTFTRTLFAGILQSVTLLKRGDDLREGVVKAYQLFDCRWSRITKAGQPIQGDWAVDHLRILHIPRRELDRVGISYINVLDRFIDRSGRYWQPETPQLIDIKLFENEADISCTRIDPPSS